MRNILTQVSFPALPSCAAAPTMGDMHKPLATHKRRLALLYGLFLLLETQAILAEPTPTALNGFNAYTASVESRLARQHRSPGTFLIPAAEDRLRRGDLIVERIPAATAMPLDGALLHHWRGTAFAPGARAVDFERLLRDFNAHPQRFAPEVLQARTLSQNGDRMTAAMRVRQHHVLSVVMDTTYDIDFGQLDYQHGYSISHSTRIDEIANPGTPTEHALSASQEHGFLWRLNTYWSYEERDGGLYLQVESVSLTRAIPTGLGWAVGPFVESIPHQSLEFTLRSACTALHK